MAGWLDFTRFRYKANGWLGMLLGVRLWYAFYGVVMESEQAFETKLDELCRELGERGKPPPAPSPPIPTAAPTAITVPPP